MVWVINWYSLPVWIAAIIAGLLGAYSWRYRSMPGVRSLLLLMLSVGIWSLGYGFEIVIPGLANKLFWAKFQYLGIASIPTFWLIYTLYFTGHSAWITVFAWRLMLLVPLVTAFLAWTNEWHGLIWKAVAINQNAAFPVLTLEYGPWFWVNIFYSYTLIITGMVLLTHFMLRSQGLFRRQARSVLLSSLLPWLGNAIHLSHLNPIPDLDLTPFAFSLGVLIIAWDVLRLQFLDLIPLARYSVVESMADAMFVLDAWDRIVDVNPSARVLFPRNQNLIGKQAAEVFGIEPELYLQFKGMHNARESIHLTNRENPVDYEIRISPLKDLQGNFSGRLIVLHDISEREQARRLLQKANDELEKRVQERTLELEATNIRLKVEITERRAAEEALVHQTLHDVLTGLPNRRLFLDRLDQAFERAKRYPGYGFAVVFLDLDHFKEVNDHLGHNVGDELLVAIAGRLKRNLRTVDTLARFGGDEFAILMEEINEARDSLPVVERVLSEFSAPFKVNEQEILSGASIGIALSSPDYNGPDEILRDADAAMYQAKAEGRGRYVFFLAQ